MSKKKKLRFFIALVVCFLLGAVPALIGIHLGWATTTIAFVLIGVCVVVTPVTFALISGIKDED